MAGETITLTLPNGPATRELLRALAAYAVSNFGKGGALRSREQQVAHVDACEEFDKVVQLVLAGGEVP